MRSRYANPAMQSVFQTDLSLRPLQVPGGPCPGTRDQGYRAVHVLLVKLSSLGDIVHTLPAVEDAARRGATFDWVAEESFAAVPALHRSVRRVIPTALRRWRKPGERRAKEIRTFGRALRRERYDLVIDAQGLIKSALVAFGSRGRVRAGFDRTSAREPAAALFYTRRAAVAKTATR